jgi:hypothetical protein
MRAELGRAWPFSSVVAANGHEISDESDITTERRSPGVLETLARYARLLVSVPFNLRGGVGSPHKALAIKYRAGGRSPAGY